MHSSRLNRAVCLRHAVAAAAWAYAASLFGHSGPSLTVLPTLGGTYGHTALGVNDAGEVVGTSNTTGNLESHAVLYSGGVLKDLTFAGPSAVATGINDAGKVIGYTGESQIHAFVYDHGTATDLGTLGGTISRGFAINNSGQAVGESYILGDEGIHPFLYSGGAMSDLGTLGGSTAQATGISDAGQIVGSSSLVGEQASHAFVYSSGIMKDLGTLGGTQSTATGINESGQVVGSSTLVADGPYHAFLYGNGLMKDLGTLGGNESFATGVNDYGYVVGYSWTTGQGSVSAFLFSSGVMNDLNLLFSDLLSDGSMAGFTSLTQANAISDDGLIVGQGLYFDGTSTRVRAFALSTQTSSSSLPPRPSFLDGEARTASSVPDAASTGGLLALALAAMLGMRRRLLPR